ncbi:molybdopterin molybdotransferase MoeA [Aureimonas altamirensis]|uniref:molybdopterin molybdotransferase MoeA n=1 Tax=Aureimonas altamirensis TaxID=370622 RepID=UPI001E548FF5|nr:gephyrin-like molybdotransferase Glp [Aureimonas altamirensis]UHD47861.1 molybdopterin molybdotransferase MoeA [Aureimonas altamirensis]
MPVEEALSRLLRGVDSILETETVALRAAAGRVLADDISALRTQPPFDASAMDGYAVRAADAFKGAVLRVTGISAAGAAFAGTVEPGAAVRIFTGAPLPAGADTVLIQENATLEAPDALRVDVAAETARHIRKAGLDFAQGAVLLRAGLHLRAGHVALAASAGHPHLSVRRRPRVAILATGDELVMPGESTGPDQIVASNGFGLAAMVEAHGGDVLDLGIAPDDLAVLEARLAEAEDARADVIVTIGGASVGDRDLVAPALQARGVELDFWKVAMRPGKPVMAGRKGALRVIGLPGNPASTMVAATLFLRPLVRRLAGLGAGSGFQRGVLSAAMPQGGERADFVRARLHHRAEGAPKVEALPRQDSSLLSIYALADALLYRPVAAPAAEAGQDCLFIPLD